MRCAVLFGLVLAGSTLGAEPADQCIAFVTTNLAKGGGNWYAYERFADVKVKVRAGDVLSYRIFLDPNIPVAKGGVDADFEDGGKSLRDLGVKDERGITAHGDGDLSPAKGHWLERRIDISPAAGRTVVAWTLSEEGDKDGVYAQFVDDVIVTHADGSKTSVYLTGAPPSRAVLGVNGFTHEPVCIAVDSGQVREGADIKAVVAKCEELGTRFKALENARRDVEVARKFAERNGDPHISEHVVTAEAALGQAERENATAEEVTAALHKAKESIQHTHPVMEQYTGHLVGHAHIDLQWLWEWQEGIVFSRDTFAQAVKFMDEFPGFTFSQSSSCLYQAIEEHYPDLFAKIRDKVKAGQWEVVGGRVCEGDTNMISEESSARQFLYGQRYFRERFGKTAAVGWEPDTFGHTIQMPQMLKLAGCEYYYFCRGGKGKPLFWWKGLDGTRVLAFDEPATGSWYNSDLSYQQFQEMLDFEKTTGSKDTIWVYGVGNHGGGPTREQIQWAMDKMKSGEHPGLRFSTATEFFRKLSTYDLTKIPEVNEELNPVFDGCYTTHCEIKQLNRRAEAMTTSAEAVAAAASLWGFAYPRAELRKNWEQICFNHHHDTLPGSGIHAPYARTQMQLERVIAEDRDIITRAMESIVIRTKPRGGGVNVLVFNPSGWTRSGWVRTNVVKSGWDSASIPDPEHAVAEAPDGKTFAVRLEDRASRGVRFWADSVPGFGYRVFRLVSGEAPKAGLDVRDGGATVETDRYIVEFDRKAGQIKRLFDKGAKRECTTTGLGRLEAHWENVQGMSAWVLGKIEKVDRLAATDATFEHGADWASATFRYTLPAWNSLGGESVITQRFRIPAEGEEITCDVECTWNAVGTNQSPNAMLRVAFDTGVQDGIATYHVPFGALSRPMDGREFPALGWADISGATGGIAVLNDSKHGLAAKNGSLTMSLIRSSFEPDPAPNPGTHRWRYAMAPHEGGWKQAELAKRASAFEQPLMSATVPYDAAGGAPQEWSVMEADIGGAVATCLKVSEDDASLVARLYEPTGTATKGTLKFARAPGSLEEVNFLEDRVKTVAGAEGGAAVELRPFEIKSFKFDLPRADGKK